MFIYSDGLRRKLLLLFSAVFVLSMFFSLFFKIQRATADIPSDPNQGFLGVNQQVFYGVTNPETCKFLEPSNESNPSAGSFLTTGTVSGGTIFGSQAITTTTGEVFLNETVVPENDGFTLVAQGESLAANSAFIAGPECQSDGDTVATYLDSVTLVCNGGASVQTIPANLVNGQANFPTPNNSYSCTFNYNFLIYGQQDDCSVSGTCIPIDQNVCPFNPYTVSLGRGNSPSFNPKNGHIVIYQGDISDEAFGYYTGANFSIDVPDSYQGSTEYKLTRLNCLPGSVCGGNDQGIFNPWSDEWPALHKTTIQTSNSTPLGNYLLNVLLENLSEPTCRTTIATVVRVEESRKSICDGAWHPIPPVPIGYAGWITADPWAAYVDGPGFSPDKIDVGTVGGIGRAQGFPVSCPVVSENISTQCWYLNGLGDTCTWAKPENTSYCGTDDKVWGWAPYGGTIGSSNTVTDPTGRVYEFRRPNNSTVEYKCSVLQPPTASSVTVTEPNYCIAGPSAFINWTYSSPQGKPQSAYQVQVDNQASFQDPELDSGKVLSSGTSYFATPLQFDVTYRARVRVWDSSDVASPWVVSTSWKTPAHAYPAVDFTWVPFLNPSVKQSIQFTDLSVFYDANGVGQRSWSWLFGDGGTSNIQNPSYIYNNFGSYNVTETVTDKDGFSCSLSKPINIERPIPVWKEVNPN